MRAIAKAFIFTAVAYGIAGMLLGIDMAMRHDHAELPTHAHIMVIGWLSFAIFGFFYALFGDGVPRWLGIAHFWFAQVSLLVLIVGLWFVYAGQTQFDPVAGIGALGYAASFVLFAIATLFGLRTRAD